MSKRLNEYSWEEIKKLSLYNPETIFAIGDKKDITLTDGEILTMAIADFHHDIDANGNKIPISFTAVNVLEKECSMRGMQAYLKDLYEKRLPEEVRAVITPAVKSGECDPLWLLSENEIFGRTIYARNEDGEQYPYYAEKCHRCKFKNSEEYASWYWERSAFAGSSGYFCGVNTSGSANYNYASYSHGVAPGFCV